MQNVCKLISSLLLTKYERWNLTKYVIACKTERWREIKVYTLHAPKLCWNVWFFPILTMKIWISIFSTHLGNERWKLCCEMAFSWLRFWWIWRLMNANCVDPWHIYTLSERSIQAWRHVKQISKDRPQSSFWAQNSKSWGLERNVLKGIWKCAISCLLLQNDESRELDIEADMIMDPALKHSRLENTDSVPVYLNTRSCFPHTICLCNYFDIWDARTNQCKGVLFDNFGSQLYLYTCRDLQVLKKVKSVYMKSNWWQKMKLD